MKNIIILCIFIITLCVALGFEITMLAAFITGHDVANGIMTAIVTVIIILGIRDGFRLIHKISGDE